MDCGLSDDRNIPGFSGRVGSTGSTLYQYQYSDYKDTFKEITVNSTNNPAFSLHDIFETQCLILFGGFWKFRKSNKYKKWK